MVHTTTPHVALNCLIHCLQSVNEIWPIQRFNCHFFENNDKNKGDHSVLHRRVHHAKGKRCSERFVRKRTNKNMYQCGTDGKTIHKKGDPNVPWMDSCLGTIFWTHCEDWHLSHCNSRTERPISKSSWSTSIRRRFEWTTLSVKTWVPGTENFLICRSSGEKIWESNSSQQVPESYWVINFILTRKGSFSGLSTNWAEYFADEKQPNRSAIILFVYVDPELKLVGLIKLGLVEPAQNWQDDKWADNG